MLFEDEYQERIEKLIEMVKALKIGEIRTINDVIVLVPKVVKLVEQEEWVLESEDKRKLAVSLINRLIDIPYLPEFLEAQIFGIMIDVAIIVLNELVGKNWIEKVR